ncbi:MAG: DUF502 domain-containing protein [Leptolyngbya sp. PLA3]|nr:MAG: DUF502 domain-containing protein [Cyanobacteria bacterium CYA]MCE7967665.1 DUF502 domain-containing protein [Leptolyngbya sp. PL-A3]
MARRNKTFRNDFRHFFGRGLAILLPSVLTLWLLWQAFSFLLKNVAEPINTGLRAGTVWAVPIFVDDERPPKWFIVTEEQIRARLATGGATPADPEVVQTAEERRSAVIKQIRRDRLRDFWQDQWYLQILGLFIAVLLIYLAGLLLGNIVGRQLYLRLEKLIARIPGFKQVYPHVKQVVDLVLGEKPMAFNTVVIVEYPIKDAWTLGFLTGESFKAIDEIAGGDVVSVFVPTSPTPFTGFVINLRKDLVHIVKIPVDEALRFVITGGILTPEKVRAAQAKGVGVLGPGSEGEGAPPDGSAG